MINMKTIQEKVEDLVEFTKTEETIYAFCSKTKAKLVVKHSGVYVVRVDGVPVCTTPIASTAVGIYEKHGGELS